MFGPFIPVLCIGISYAFCSVMFWCSVYQACDYRYLGVSYGLLNGSLNLLPSIVPYFLYQPGYGIETKTEYYTNQCLILAIMAGISSLFACMASRLAAPLDYYWYQYYSNQIEQYDNEQ